MTPQATWRDDERVASGIRWFGPHAGMAARQLAELAVAADRRIQAATLRAKIEALPPRSRSETLRNVLAEVDAVLGGAE